MIELKTGEPRVYELALACLLGVLLLSLILEPLKSIFTAMILTAACLVLIVDSRSRQLRSRFHVLSVSADYSMTLVDVNLTEYPVTAGDSCWVTRWLIVIPLILPDGKRVHILVSRSENDFDAFRRFSVFARYGFAVEQTERHNVARLRNQSL